MVRRFLVTVRIRRRNAPPRVRRFVVDIARPASEWGDSWPPLALLLRFVRDQLRMLRRRRGFKNDM
ncbi:PREDICTED: cyclin-dependent kinase inhibitor 2A, isoform 4-like [Chrysochloris asiatica]|uniref:Cyclin-dependent kinase inhibitor 2A, isoform 4-like n=1 Tax=Chrysochloris asiatica TaxID=185453 RepID=A0A9B0TMX0_CHRAS|nr:PREDICTED: cyclin-dependent kinase inhibitor 2A, isoform 4-like [Chrysochloris asiatica]